MNFRHFIITRFNIPAKGFSLDKKKVTVNDDIWLKDRIVLFETYCIASIKTQTCKNFVWLVFFDEKSPQYLKEKIDVWEKDCPQFCPIYVVDYDDFSSNAIFNSIKGKLNNEEYIITTRLDNDDALLSNAVENIQSNFISKDNVIIDIERGFSYDINKGVLSARSDKSGPFISYIEKIDAIQTVYKYKHRQWVDIAEFISINEMPLWVQIIHERNVLNTINGKPCYKIPIALKKEPICKENIFFISFWETLKYGIKYYYSKMKNFVRYLIKK